MAGLNGVMKAIDNLNTLQQTNNTLDPSIKKAKKMNYCLAITNGISSPAVKSVRNFATVLGLSIKTLLTLCDDEESDVRTLTDESLNKIIRSMSDGNIPKVQFEFYNEIHRNGNWRPLRAALSRFGLLSHTIKPAKGKPYISNLIPCIVAISKRSEELVIDTLSQSLPLILNSLGSFMSEKDTKSLLKAFYPNLSSSQATLRRNAANMIVDTCLHCRKPRQFLFYVLRYLIDVLIPVSSIEENLHQVVGVLGCLKLILPHIDVPDECDADSIKQTLDCLLQTYELCLRYIQWHSDHNVINAALETLAQILRSNNEQLINILTAEKKISNGGKIFFCQRTIKLSSSESIHSCNHAQTDNENVANVPTNNSTSENTPDGLEQENLLNDMNALLINDDESQNIEDYNLNIGSFSDSDVPLKYCCRYLTSSYLLTGTSGQLVSDSLFRVSVKSLALTCIGSIISLYPNILLDSLEKNVHRGALNPQMMTDILLFVEHSDPQLRGNVAIIVGRFLKAMYEKYQCSYNAFHALALQKNGGHESITLDGLIALIVKVLEDESATSCRQGLTAVNICITSLLNSNDDYSYGIHLIHVLLPLANNIYFLVKMNLVKVLSELPYLTIKYLMGDSRFQRKVTKIFIELLGDEDPRVRRTTSDVITKFIEMAYNEKPNNDEIIQRATHYTEKYIIPIIASNLLNTRTYHSEHKFFIDGMIEPFRKFYTVNSLPLNHHENIEDTLSVMIGMLVAQLIPYSSKYLIYGCIEALCQLNRIYPITLYPNAWDCRIKEEKLATKATSKVYSSNCNISSDDSLDMPVIGEYLLPISNQLSSWILFMITTDCVAWDLSTHKNLLSLAGNLLSGCALKHLKTININDVDDSKTTTRKMWNLFDDKQINSYYEILFKHLMRLMNIYVHVNNDIPITVSSSKSTLPSLLNTSSLSPRKKITTNLEQKIRDRGSEKIPINFLKSGKESIGAFCSLQHYMKLYEILKASHANYKSTLDVDASQMYLGLLNVTLEVMSQILEIASTYEARKIAEEILHYLETTLTLSMIQTVQCVRQLLKSLFGMNLSARWDELEDIRSPDDRIIVKSKDKRSRGLYDQCFQKPVCLMSDLIKIIGNNCCNSDFNDSWTIGDSVIHRRRDSERKLDMIFKTFARSNNQKTFFASFIRIFEPMVIKSLNLYTTTNSVECQCQVLGLLSQLVQFHVNYCLLDTDKTFIDFVLGQFVYIEESQIRHTEILLPKIFGFLVHLSYEKFHSKVIIDIWEIIKLCDGLMASGQPPMTHCIPAIIPVVRDIFISRSTLSSSLTGNECTELDTTREYLMSMLLRLIDYHPIIELLAQCLHQCRRDDDAEKKWRKWSRSTMDAILPELEEKKIHINSEDAFIALIKLFTIVSPTVFRPVDPLLKLLFKDPPVISESPIKLERWMAMINIIFLTLMSYTKEYILLGRLSEMQVCTTDLDTILHSSDAFGMHKNVVDPLNVSIVEESSSLAPERRFVLIIFRVLFVAATKLLFHSSNYCDSIAKQNHHNDFLTQQLAFFMQLCIYLFESNCFCKIAQATMAMLNDKKILRIDELNQLMIDVSHRNCLILTHWIYLMRILRYNDQSFWARVLAIESRKEYDIKSAIESSQSQGKSIDAKIISGCATTLFCDYLCDHLDDVESLSWLMLNHIEDVMKLSNELPVRNLVTREVHHNSAASGLLIQAIAARCLDLSKPSLIKKLLQSLQCAHESQSGAVILIIIPRFLSTPYLTLSMMASDIAEKRVEMLLKSDAENVIEQLPTVDLSKLMETLQSTKLAKKYCTLVTLLNQLIKKFYDVSPLELEYCRPFNSSTVKNVKLTKSWFVSQVRLRCCNPNRDSIELYECAKMLRHLEVNDCNDIMTSTNFDMRILDECIKLGLRLTHEQNIKENTFTEAKYHTNEKENIETNSKCLSSLFQCAKRSLSSHVHHIVELMPKPHQVYEPLFIKDEKPSRIMKYANEFAILVDDEIFHDRFFALVPATISYMKSVEYFDREDIRCIDPKFDNVDLAEFALLCLEVLHWMIHSDESSTRRLKPHEMELCLNCAAEILQNECVGHIFGYSCHYTWVCSAANTLTRFIQFWLSPYNILIQNRDCLPQVESRGLSAAFQNDSTKYYAQACLQMAKLISWLEINTDLQISKNSIPDFAHNPMKRIIIIISRQKLVNSFVLTPPLVWKHGWHSDGSGKTLCHFPLLLSTDESNYLQELDVLRQFVYRITLLGWTSRCQFEEIWMALLSVLNASISENRTSQSESNILGCNSQVTSLAVQAITRLLVQTLLLPYPGSPVNSTIMHHSRDPPLSLQRPASRRLYNVQDLITWKYIHVKEFNIGTSSLRNFATDALNVEHIFTRGNIERDRITNGYDYLAYSQLSVMFLWSSCSLHEDKLSASVIKLMKKRNDALSKSSLDLTSCIRFLIELYSRWMAPSASTSAHLLDEVVKSIIAISDLFVERNQFQWMLDTCWNLEQSFSLDDEILHYSLIFSICKAAAVLVPLDIESLDKVKRVTNIGLKSAYLPCRIATLHGILYLLQSAVHANCDETMNVIHPLAIKYIQDHLNTKKGVGIAIYESEEHHRIMWALVFFLLEHIEDIATDADAPTVLELAFTAITQPNISVSLHRTLLYGLERLIATRSAIGRVADQIIKLSLERLKQPGLSYLMPALRLLLTCMYSEAADRFNRSAMSNEDQPLPDIEPEALMCTIERTSAIFDRIKRGYSKEVKILCAILSEILSDFFPPFETLTKVIGEFLSPQQHHQRLISGVVFKVCERVTGNAEQLTLLQDWVLFSLPNFIQSLPLVTSTWCLSCFFVSASTNQWLRALFPYVQTRIGKYEYEDKKLLCLAALDFYRELSNESQRKAFIQSFSTAENKPSSPFSDIFAPLLIANNQ